VRVLIVTNMWPTAERPALGSFVRDQVEALRRIDGLEVELFAFAPEGGYKPYLQAARELRRRYAKERFDVVHSHYGLTAWCTLALRGGAPRVVTFHGTDLGHAKVGPLSRRVAKLMDLPATASGWLARHPTAGLRGAGTTRRVAVLPCGVNMERFGRRDRRAAREQLGLDPDGRYLLFPADPARPEKRHDRAAELAQAAGAELLSYDSVPPSDVPLLINAANAVVVTSEREGFGLAALEALACDVPVTSTDVGIAPLALSGVAGTLVAPFDTATWLAALRPHLDDADPRIDGRARAALFDSNRMAMRVFESYRALTESGPDSLRTALGPRI
jgi:teichuronic acid biosynthesis glycosyltransferase TuaC